LFLCQGICGKFSRGVFIVEDVKNIGPNYDPTLLARAENFRRAWPRFADRYGERFRRMWRFYLLNCAGAFRARSLQVFSILFSKEDAARESSPQPVRRVADTDEKETKLNAVFHATLK
jgi:cyclopropane-fatty-acyl-phospholipid synthase